MACLRPWFPSPEPQTKQCEAGEEPAGCIQLGKAVGRKGPSCVFLLMLSRDRLFFVFHDKEIILIWDLGLAGLKEICPVVRVKCNHLCWT
jgi:hypothetical protein